MVRIACLAAGARAFAGSRRSSTSRPANQLGFNDLKAIEVAGYLEAIAERPADPFNLAAGLHGQTLVETIRDSSRAAARRDVS
jgi:hypothetical protein